MSSSNNLAKYLGAEQRNSLALEISKNLGNEEAIEALLEIIGLLDEKTLTQISPLIINECKKAILKQHEQNHGSILLLLKVLPTVYREVVGWVGALIQSILKTRINYSFGVEAIEVNQKHIASVYKELDIDPEQTPLSDILESLDLLYSFEVPGVSSELDKLICFLLSNQDATLSTQASKILRWRANSLINIDNFIWDLIPCLMQTEGKSQTTNGYVLWLRFMIDVSKREHKPESLLLQMKSEDYWQYIQSGLGSSIHEHKKYSLSILKLSIQQLNTDIDHDLIYYKESESSKIVEEWKKFITLFEIIGIDTALNQAEAAKNDIIQLLTPDSYVKSSWGMVLLATALKGSMESVRKFALDLMYSTKPENLSIYAHEYLTSVCLRYAVDSPHFQVKKSDSTLKCEYGLKLANFIEKLLKSVRASEETYIQLVSQLLDLLVDLRSIFAPARFYLSYGLLKGLRGKKPFTSSHVTQIIKLFESTSEDEVFEKSIQTIHLKLLNHIEPNIELLLKALTKFVQFNGYELYNDHSDLFLDYVATFNDGTLEISPENKEVEYQIIAFHLLNIYSITDEFLIELAKSKVEHSQDFNIRYSMLLTDLIKGAKSTYTNSSSLIKMPIFRNSWKNIDLSNLYKQLLESIDFEKFQFFVGIYDKAAEISDLSVIDFEGIKKWYASLKASNYDYKSKDRLMGSYFDLLLAFLKMTPLNESQINVVISQLTEQASSSMFYSTIAICNVLQFLFKNYDFDFISGLEILEIIWNQITAERLVLNQKEMHLKFIETVFNEKLLKDSINNEYNAKILHRIGLQIIEQSFTRRSFLPTLTSKIISYRNGYTVEFDQTLWLIEVIVKAFTLVQDECNLFRLKPVIAKIYDNDLKLHGDLYEDVFGKEEASTRINIVQLLLSCSTVFADEFFETVLTHAKYQLLSPSKKENGTEERQRILAFSLLLMISQRISTSLLSQTVSKNLLPALVTEPSPLVRTYIEWIITLDMVNNGSNKDQLFSYFNDQSKPALVTSAERIAFMTAQKLPSPTNFEYFNEFAQHLITNCTSNKPLIRHFSNSLILSVQPALKSKGLQLPVHSILDALYVEAKKSEVTGQYRSGDALIWDAKDDFNLVSIFGGVLSRTSPRDIDLISHKEFTKYLGEEEFDVKIGYDFGPVWKQIEEQAEEKAVNTNSPLQTKSGAWETIIDLDQSSKKIKRSELIVISSLVDKPPNLGGICRLCDVLGAGLMTVDDLRVKKHPQFKNVAVTADYHMPIEEVKIEDIPQFMKEKKKEGYTLIGLEQTDQSIVLGKDTEFPAKSVILIGKEAEGIPGELLAELDYCVEIRQVGVIRSMNIQTATAVIVHAYSSSQVTK